MQGGRFSLKRPPPALHKAQWDQFSFLAQISDEHMEELMGRMTVKTFRKGDLIIAKGTIGTSMYFLDVGRAQAVLDGEVLTELSSGACFGEIAFLASCNKVLRRRGCNDNLAVRVCDVRAVDVVRLVELTVRDFLLVVEPEARETCELSSALYELETLASGHKANMDDGIKSPKRLARGSLSRTSECGSINTDTEDGSVNADTSDPSSTPSFHSASRGQDMPPSPKGVAAGSPCRTSEPFGPGACDEFELHPSSPQAKSNEVTSPDRGPQEDRSLSHMHRELRHSVEILPVSPPRNKCAMMMPLYVQAHRLLRAKRNARFACPSSSPSGEAGQDVWSPKAQRSAQRCRHRAERLRTIDSITFLAAGWLARHGFVAGEIAAAAPDANTLEESAVFAGRFSDAYVLGKVIGEGSWAEVRQCVAAGKSNAEGGTVYAVKILKRDKSKRKHMQNEIAALTRAQHPHCVRLEDVFMEDEIYIVMEQLTGGTVLERIIEMDCYSEADARNVTSQVLVALDYLHGIGIVHRDLKPENLLYVSADPSSPQYDHVKLSDFGFSRASDYHAMHTTCGTPEYMAPEVLTMSAGGYGAKVDLWSMGVVLYVMLAGYFPFQSHSQPTLFRKIMQGEYDFPDAYWADVSEGAKDMIRGMLQADPARRINALKGLKHAWITERESVSRKKLHGSHRAFLLIRRLPLFTDVSPECLQEVVNNLRFVRVDAGEHIMRSGDVGDSMYFINQGHVSVQVNGGEIDRLTTGDIFGEVALVMASQRIADVVALGRSHSSLRSEAEEFRISASESAGHVSSGSSNDGSHALASLPLKSYSSEGNCPKFQEHAQGEGVGVSHTSQSCASKSVQMLSHEEVTSSVQRRSSAEERARMHGAVELFRLMKMDFESVLEKFPILKTRLVTLGKIRLKRKAKFGCSETTSLGGGEGGGDEKSHSACSSIGGIDGRGNMRRHSMPSDVVY